MLILTRSHRIRRALGIVRARIPSKDWQTVSAFLSKVWAETAWQTLGLGTTISEVAGELRPLKRLQDGSVCGAHIRFNLPLCRLYSNKAMVGLVAHELAHALRAAQIGEGWVEKMGGVWGPGADRKYRLEERWADAIATAWGFRAQIRAMREERQTVLNPYLASEKNQILRQIARRDPEAVNRLKNLS